MNKGSMKGGLLIFACILFLCGCDTQQKNVSFTDLTEKISQILVKDLLEGSPITDQLEENFAEAGRKPEINEQVYQGIFLESGSRYGWERLDEKDRVWYREMEQILGDMASDGKLTCEDLKTEPDAERIDRVFQKVLQDHPEFFFVDGYSYNTYTRDGEMIAVTFSGSYNVSFETAVQRKQQIEEAVQEILKNAPVQDDYAKIRYIYETIIRSTDYSLEAADNQNLYSVLVGGQSVCQGYAKATQYLLNRLDVECTIVQGMVQKERHGWNLVKADGDYYYVDTTWGDASYQSGEGTQEISQEINYDYLCVTSEELFVTHCPDENQDLPDCTAVRNNYYVREGLFFETADFTAVKELFRKAVPENSYYVTLKCANRDCCEDLLCNLITEGNVFRYYPENSGSVVYVQNENQFTLTFWMTNEKSDDIL